MGDGNSITSGPALATANTTNIQNTNLTAVSGVGSEGVVVANTGTGEDSFNVAGGLDLDVIVVANINDAELRNGTIAMANSGFNGISGDDENSISTGTATAEANTTNVQNTNLTEISGSGSELAAEGGTGATGNSATNTGTGECSENWAVAADVDATVVVNVNDADLSNATVSTANSGNNSVSGEDTNSVTTGGATATANTTNVQNTNMTGVGDVSCLPPICDVGGCQPPACGD